MKKSKLFIVTIGILLLCHFSQGHSSTFPLNDSNFQTNNDTTVYDAKILDATAILQDAISYFLKNNKYKDWKETDGKIVAIKGVVEKDGTITNVKILKSSGVDILDAEALRLIKAAKYNPGKYNNEIVRSTFSIVVLFPAQKQ